MMKERQSMTGIEKGLYKYERMDTSITYYNKIQKQNTSKRAIHDVEIYDAGEYRLKGR